MPDLNQITTVLRGVPDQALQQELSQPSGLAPSYLVLAEAQRRQLLRQAAEKQQAQGQSSSVLDDVVRNMMAQQPPAGPPAPVGMTPPRQGQAPLLGAAPPGQQPTPTPPQMPQRPPGMARGGVLRMADGGTDDDNEVDDEDQPQVSPQGEAARAATQPVNVDDLAEAMIQFEGSRLPSSPGFRDNNPGHLRYIGQKGSFGKDALGFARFNSWDAGLEAMKQQIRTNLKRGLTLSEMIGGKKGVYSGWAPAADRNNPANYVRHIVKQTGYDPDTLMEEGAKAGARGSAIRQPVLAAPGWTPSFPAQTETEAPLEETKTEEGTTSQPSETDEDTAQTMPQDIETDEGDGENEGDETTSDETPKTAEAKPAGPSVVIPSAPAYDPFSAENIQKNRDLMNALGLGANQQLEQTRIATVRQLQGLQQEMLQRYRSPSPWEFLSNISAGMGSSGSLNLASAFGQGVGLAWQRRDAAQQQALSNIEGLQQRIDALQNVGETERQRMGTQMVNLLTRGKTTPQGQQEFRKFMELGAPYGVMDPQQAPEPGMIGIPDPDHPGYGVWVKQNQALKAPKGQQLTGAFEKDFLPGWAEEHNTTVDKITGVQRKQALQDYKASLVAPLDDKTRDYYVKQVTKDATNWNLVPPVWKTQVGQALAAAGVDVQRLDAATRQLERPQDPKEVAYLADQVQQDQKNWSMTSGNKGLQEAVRRELANRGVNVAQLDASIRQTAQFAQTVQPHIKDIFQQIDKIDPKKLGPLFGRWEEWRAGKFGAGDPEYVELRNNINLLDSALARIHGGARGGGSPAILEYMHSMLSAGPKDARTMRAGLNVFSNWVNEYAGMAPKAGARSPSSGGTSTGAGTSTGGRPQPPAGALDNLAPGHVRTFKNGQRWQKNADGSVQYLGGGQ